MLSDRSRAIVTFALCGFANFSSIAIQMAVTGGLAPNQRPVIARLGLRALLAGSLANLMSAALAGLMISLVKLSAMATITDDHIASVSLKDADRDPDAFAQKLGRSFEDYGFAIIADHGIPDELIHRAEDKAKAFFALPDEVKRKYLIEGGGGQRGYTPFGIETAKGAKAFDLKEFWHVGRDLRARPPVPRPHARQCLAGRGCRASRTRSRSCTRRSSAPGLKILKAIARYLKIDEDYFVDTVRDGNSVHARCSIIRRSGRAGRATFAPARMRTSTRSRCCSAPRKRGLSC